jgi:NADH:ubiquinone oxidoreductase subunit 6 (subunit J)
VEIYLLLGAGALFAALFALNNLLKLLLRRGRVGFIDLLLVFLTTLVPLAALVVAQTTDAPDGNIARLVILLGAALAVFSLVLMLLELFRAQRWKGSRGILGLVSGLLLMISSVSVPMSAAYITQQAAAPTSLVDTAAPAASGTSVAQGGTPTARLTSTQEPTNLPTNTPMPTETPTPRATLTPSATRFQYSTRTPTALPTDVAPCIASVEFNLRLRSAPNADSETLMVIPFGTTIELYGRGEPSVSDTGEAFFWWYTRYEGQEGWVDGQYLLLGSTCDNLPLRDAE